MPKITLEHVTKRWDKFYAVEDLNLVIEDNAFVTLLGPSGCGKTTTLRMIAGLETPTSGRICIGNQVVFDSKAGINVPPNKRKVGFLFQNYALWPNMTVYQNIAFGLGNIKEPLPKIDLEARRAAALLRALERPEDVVNTIRDCVDKATGKPDKNRALIRLIDRYELSMAGARELMGYGLHASTNPGCDAKARREEKKKTIRTASERARAEGCELSPDFTWLKNGEPLRTVRKLSAEEIDLAVRRVARIVKIGMFMDRYPAELSGGQQQRVAIARTLAPEPGVLFMDEPLSNLDAKLRLEMRTELQRLHLETGSTFVYVTHDQMEAMTLATKICLIDNGVLQQYDAPLQVYGSPANTFVADFVGSPSINFIEAQGTQEGGQIVLRLLGDHSCVFAPVQPLDLAQWYAAQDAADRQTAEAEALRARQKGYVEKGNKDTVFRCHFSSVEEPEDNTGAEKALTDEELVLGVRPEFLEISEDGPLEGEVYSAMPTGMETTVRLRDGSFLLTGVVFGGVVYRIGQKIRFGFRGDGILLFSRRNGRLISRGSLLWMLQ